MKKYLLVLSIIVMASCASTSKEVDREPNQVSGGGSGNVGSVTFAYKIQTKCSLQLNSKEGENYKIPIKLDISGALKDSNYMAKFSGILADYYTVSIAIFQSPTQPNGQFSTSLVLKDTAKGVYTANLNFIDHSSPELQSTDEVVRLGYEKAYPKVVMPYKTIQVTQAALVCDLSK